MSTISQYVHTAPPRPKRKVVAEPTTKVKHVTTQHHTDSKESLLKIIMFIAILMCIVLAVNL